MIDIPQHIENIPDYIFGKGSLIANSGSYEAIGGGVISPTSDIFQVVVAIIAILYLMWTNKWSLKEQNNLKLFAFLGRHRGGYAAKADSLTPSFKSYAYSAITLGAIVVWGSLLKVAGLSQSPASSLIESGDLSLAGMLMLALMALILFQGVIIGSISYIINHKEFTGDAIRIKGVCAAIFTLTTTPTILCYILSQNSISNILLYIVCIQLLVITLIYIYETFLLFMAKKVSILHTILYLCAVEIFPLTLIWGYFYR